MRIVGSQCENQAENRLENQVTQSELPNTAVYIYLCGASLWLGNNRRFQVFEKKSEWTNRWFQFQNKFKWELKNARLQAFERIRDERTAGFSYWKILKEPTGLLNEPAKNRQFSGWLFDFNAFFENHGYRQQHNERVRVRPFRNIKGLGWQIQRFTNKFMFNKDFCHYDKCMTIVGRLRRKIMSYEVMKKMT